MQKVEDYFRKKNYTATFTQAVWYWNTHRTMGQNSKQSRTMTAKEFFNKCCWMNWIPKKDEPRLKPHTFYKNYLEVVTGCSQEGDPK